MSTDVAVERQPGAERLALALDADDLTEAVGLARELAPWFGVAKVGLELFSAAGPEAVAAMRRLGYDVFVDLKMFDIPTTVRRAAAVVGAGGARYLTLHTAGGVDMLGAGVEGLTEGAAAAGHPRPIVLGVTVLTSEPDAPVGVLVDRVAAAVQAGCGGVVCAAPDLPVVGEAGPSLLTVVPGIRPSGAALDDQRRVATPGEAIAAGAGLLVVGRGVTAAPDRRVAAAAVAADVAEALAER